MQDARLMAYVPGVRVEFYDAGSGLYLSRSTDSMDVVIRSLDKARELGRLPIGATSLDEAASTIAEWINDRDKGYGAEAGLWS